MLNNKNDNVGKPGCKKGEKETENAKAVHAAISKKLSGRWNVYHNS